MALFWYTLMVLVTAFSWASEQQPGSQPLRSFNDGRQDKFNGNFESIDTSAALANHQKGHPSDYASNDRPSSSVKIRPMAQQYHSFPQNRYGASSSSFYEDDLRIDRFGESHDSAVIPSNNRRTGIFSGAKSGNLALVVSPLAGIAFLAAAAAVAVSPVYLTISSSLTGRKKRDLLSTLDPSLSQKIPQDMVKKIQELQTLEKFLASVPKETDYQQQIMSMYLSCSGYTEEKNQCLDRVFCEYGNGQSAISEEERDVLSIVLYNIMSNTFVPEEYKKRLRTAARIGRDFQQCGRYNCPVLSQQSSLI